MGENLQIPEIVVFALVVAFLLFRLRSVLGRRTGNERPPQDASIRFFRNPPARAPSVGAPPVIDATAARLAEPHEELPAPSGLAQLKAVDKSFDETSFLRGARGAFELVVNLFAAGDTQGLRPLLSDEVYASFAQAVSERQSAKETHETTLVTIKACELAAVELTGTQATVTVKFVSDQVNVTRAADGKVVDGDPDHIVEKTDIWTFARDTRSRDPNWLLVATKSA